MNELLEHIREYFNNFNKEDYKIYLHNPRDWDSHVEWHSIDSSNKCIILRIQIGLGTGYKYHLIPVHEIETISMESTMLEIKKTNGKEYKLVFKIKDIIPDWC